MRSHSLGLKLECYDSQYALSSALIPVESGLARVALFLGILAPRYKEAEGISLFLPSVQPVTARWSAAEVCLLCFPYV